MKNTIKEEQPHSKIKATKRETQLEQEMTVPNKILSDIIIHNKYAKYLPKEYRRETWEEIVTRNKDMHIRKFPELQEEIEKAYELVYTKKVLPSMRAMQFSGAPIELANNRIFNCCFAPIDDTRIFSETMFLLLGGSGVGYSVQEKHVNKLPPILGDVRPTGQQRKKRYLVGDSIEGWADAVKILVESYFEGKREIDFDFRDVRPKGSLLVTSGGVAPGPEPLRYCLVKIKSIFENALADRGRGAKLKTIEAHDILCHIADAVLSGGIRRAAMISLFSYTDTEMMHCKHGDWWELNPQRGRANNSVVLRRNKIVEKDFISLWETIKASGSGEPGIAFTNNEDMGFNPCFEASLDPFQMCNLCEINASDIADQKDFNNRSKVASFIGTLQASYTDFHYLREVWADTVQDGALLGVSMTGIASNIVTNLNMKEAALIVAEENTRVAKLLGIKEGKRLTLGKPSGTSSLVLGTSSGIHSWFAPYYIRRVRLNKEEALYKYLLESHPNLVLDEVYDPLKTAVLEVPQKAPNNAICRNDENAIDLLERVKQVSTDWILPGHRTGHNTHNQSVTVSIQDNEWDDTREWLWKHRDLYCGVSVLPYDGGTYQQMPFEEIDKKEYDRRVKDLVGIDLNMIVEHQDNTNLTGELACSGGSCEVK